MLKEKKKLTTKIESLTRKLQSLQSKVAGGKGPEKVVSPPSRPILSSSSTAAPSNPVPPAPTHDTRTPVSRPTSKRVVSGPASLLRPKTPERKQAQPAVFKAR